MNSRDFCYWLQGFFELAGPDAPLTKEQSKKIQAHLNMVFAHEIDPSHGTPEHRATLQDLHDMVAKRCAEAKEESQANTRTKLVEEVFPSRHSCPHDLKLMC